MEKILAAWNLATLQESNNINKHLANKGKTWDDVDAYLRAVAKRGNAPQEFRGVLCPNPRCRKPMVIFPVNTDPGNQVGGDFKSMWYCTDPRCNATIPNAGTVEAEIMAVGDRGDVETVKTGKRVKRKVQRNQTRVPSRNIVR